MAQGAYGTDSDSDVQATRLSFITGDTLQLRADLGVLRVQQDGLLVSPVGPIPSKPRGPQGSIGQLSGQMAPQAQGDSGQGSGQGTGSGSSPTAPRILSSPRSSKRASGNRVSVTSGSLRAIVSSAAVPRYSAWISESRSRPRRPTPTKDLGTGEWDSYVGITSEYRFWTATGFGGFGWNYLGDPEWAELNDVVEGYLGMESEPLADRWIVSGWIEGNPEVIEGLGSRAALGFGLRTVGKLRWRLLATIGLTEAAQDLSLLFGTSFGVATPSVGTRGPVR